MNKLLKMRGFGKVLVAGVAAVAMAGAPLAASAYGWHGGGYYGGWHGGYRGGWGRPVVVHRGPGFGAVVGGALIAGATAGLVSSALRPAPVYAAPTVVYSQPQTVVYEGVPPPVTTTTTTTTYYTR